MILLDSNSNSDLLAAAEDVQLYCSYISAASLCQTVAFFSFQLLSPLLDCLVRIRKIALREITSYLLPTMNAATIVLYLGNANSPTGMLIVPN